MRIMPSVGGKECYQSPCAWLKASWVGQLFWRAAWTHLGQLQSSKVCPALVEYIWDRFLHRSIRMSMLGPGTLYCRACIWTNISLRNRIQRNSKGLKITTCMRGWGKLWQQDTKRPNCHFWGARSESRVLHMIPAQGTTKAVGRPPEPPIQSNAPICPYAHPTEETSPRSLESEQGYLFLLVSLCCSTSPSKALPELLIWPLTSFHWRKSPGTQVGNPLQHCLWQGCWGNLVSIAGSVGRYNGAGAHPRVPAALRSHKLDGLLDAKTWFDPKTVPSETKKEADI